MTITKVCSKCKIEKPLDDFNKYHKSKDGHKCYCRECQKNEYLFNKERRNELTRKNYQQNKERYLEQTKQYRKENIEWYQENNRRYYQENKQKIKDRTKRNFYRRMEENPEYRALQRLRKRMWQATIVNGKADKTKVLIGCSTNELRRHLESQFKDGMSWENYGQWHIDHIRPCASFDFSKREDQLACFHYTNLQPLWAVENIRKSDTYDGRQHHRTF